MSPTLKLAPASTLRVSRHLIERHGQLPNTSIQSRPLLIYYAAFEPYSVTRSALEAHLTRVGVVKPQWRYTMYSTSHFHSTTHEVLAVSRGAARLCFGGEDNNMRVEPTVRKGDVKLCRRESRIAYSGTCAREGRASRWWAVTLPGAAGTCATARKAKRLPCRASHICLGLREILYMATKDRR